MGQFNNIYKDKNVLVTGHTGFKGSWLAIWLRELGAKVIGYALDPYTEKDNFVLSGLADKIIDIRGDIRDIQKLQWVFDTYKPEYVFHLAAQPIVRISYSIPMETYEVNVMGTINVLECIRKCEETKVGIFITTDKCYDNKEQWWGYREGDSLGGFDPYSSSKACAEIVVASWRQSYMNPRNYHKHGKAISTVRAGNVIGGGDWAKDRIIPDCIRALESNQPISIRNPKAIRPWQHVLDPLNGYLLLGEKMTKEPARYSAAWNFGPHLESVVPVWEVASKLTHFYGGGELLDTSKDSDLHEAKLLNLDISKSFFELNWKPKWPIDRAIYYTVDWYKKYRTQDVYDLCAEQINSFKKI
jgi:CDP-glucose 4,6-dehydratase